MEGEPVSKNSVTPPMSNTRRCEAYNAQNGYQGQGIERYTPRQNRRIRKYIRRAAGNRES